MRVVESAPDLRVAILERRVAGDSVGFVPTMGMLHAGQLSLVKRARDESGCVVVSCFANPHEFSSLDEGDHGRQDVDRDMALLEREMADLVFRPDGRGALPAPTT